MRGSYGSGAGVVRGSPTTKPLIMPEQHAYERAHVLQIEDRIEAGGKAIFQSRLIQASLTETADVVKSDDRGSGRETTFAHHLRTISHGSAVVGGHLDADRAQE